MRSRKPHIDAMYGECYTHHSGSMPRMFDALAVYNGERARGIVHTPEYAEKMAVLQEQFYEWQRRTAPPETIWIGGNDA